MAVIIRIAADSDGKHSVEGLKKALMATIQYVEINQGIYPGFAFDAETRSLVAKIDVLDRFGEPEKFQDDVEDF